MRRREASPPSLFDTADGGAIEDVFPLTAAAEQIGSAQVACLNTELVDADLEWSPSMFEDVDLGSAYLSGTSPAVEEVDTLAGENFDQTARSLIINGPLDPFNVPMELKFILNYHLFEVAPRLCVDHKTLRNPYSQYILPLAVQKPALLYACAALAACHFDVRLSNPSFHVQALRFRGKAMRRLQEQLWAEQNGMDESNLATILMLTLTDLSMGGHSQFDAHFTAARKLVDFRGSNKTPNAFVEQYIAWLDIMSAASNKRRPKFTLADIPDLRGLSREWSCDVFPCPPDQFTIVARVVELHKSLDDPSLPSVDTLAQVYALKQELLTLDMHTQRGDAWLHVTEAYRHAIALYMIRLFELTVDEDEIAWLTQSVIFHSKSTPASTGWADSLLWPLFHAGLELHDQRRRQWLRERSQSMQRSGGFRNVDTVMSVLEHVWAAEGRPDYLTLLSSEGVGNMMPV
jgi:hypothetical protein